MNECFNQILFNPYIPYAFYRIICDENEKPDDFEFCQVNNAFENLAGLKNEFLIDF